MGAFMSVIETPSLTTKLRGYLSMARISNSPTVATNVLAGAALASSFALDRRLALLVAALVAFYTAGMYLNDLCDYEIDKRERAERPLVTGSVTHREAWGITLVLFALANALLVPLGGWVSVAGLVLMGLIVLYDVWHKKNIVSPLIMGANRFMVYIIAFLAYQPALTSRIIAAAGLLLLYILGVTFIAKSETSSASFTKYWPLGVLLTPALYYALAGAGWLSWVALAGFVGWTLYSATFIYSDDKRSISTAVSFLLAGIALLDALALASATTGAGVVLAAGGFGLTLFLQQYIRGT
jgi:hypothetical protein